MNEEKLERCARRMGAAGNGTKSMTPDSVRSV